MESDKITVGQQCITAITADSNMLRLRSGQAGTPAAQSL